MVLRYSQRTLTHFQTILLKLLPTSNIANSDTNTHIANGYSWPIRCWNMYRLWQTMSPRFDQICQPLPMLARLCSRLAVWRLCQRIRHTHWGFTMKQLPLTKKESDVLDDVLNYMIDYMQDTVWSTQDRLAFDRIYSKNKSLQKWTY